MIFPNCEAGKNIFGPKAAANQGRTRGGGQATSPEKRGNDTIFGMIEAPDNQNMQIRGWQNKKAIVANLGSTKCGTECMRGLITPRQAPPIEMLVIISEP